MKILFITHSCSEKMGGREIYNYNLLKSLIKKANVKIISTGGKDWKLLWFYPYALLRGLSSSHGVDAIHLGDNAMLPVGLILSKLFRKPLSVTIYGLEATRESKFYESLFLKPLNHCSRIISISNATKNKLISKGIKTKIEVLPCGVNPTEFKTAERKEDCVKYFEKKLSKDFSKCKILVTNGRLVKRKGVLWFVEKVMPNLGKQHVYFVSGDGIEKKSILAAIKNNQLEDKVFLLGRTTNQELKKLYNAADFFIMPNIHVDSDLEGFGIVLIEAGSCGLPSIASNIEGIPDAVQDGKTGILVESENPKAFVEAINSNKKFDKSQIKKIIANNFSWEKIAEAYIKLLSRE